MNIQRIKALVWILALAVGGYLSWFVADFLKQRDTIRKPVSQDEQLAVLKSVEAPEPPKVNVVDYDEVKSGYIELNWTGKPPPPPPVNPDEITEEVETPKTPVSDLLHVLLIQVDTEDSEGSAAFVTYLDQGLKLGAKTTDDRTLRVDTKLGAPYAYISVAEISVEGVLFEFDEKEARESELVPPVRFEGDKARIVQAPNGAIIPEQATRIVASQGEYKPYNPKVTELVGRNEYKVGTNDLEVMQADYSRILSQDMRYRTHRDPTTGAVKGIEITSIAPGSIPESHGLQKGEIVKAINGHKVTGVNDAIAYVKRESDTTDTWLVLLEKNGREYTRTYHSPDD